MNAPQNSNPSPSKRRRLQVSLLMITAAVLAGASWFASAPAGMGDNACTVCHKRTQTVTVPCNSLDYRRHKDHGDPDGMCTATMGSGAADSKIGQKIDAPSGPDQ